MSKLLTGKIDPSRICMLEIPRVAADVIARYKALGDATCAVSDALDEIGIRGIVAGSRLIPTIAGARMVGPALTLRNVLRQEDPAVLADRQGRGRLYAHHAGAAARRCHLPPRR